MSSFLTPDDVLTWARAARDASPHLPNVASQARDDREAAAALAKGMRYKAVWETHRDRLLTISEPSRYNKSNRETMAKAVRALCYAMARAEEGEAQ